MKNTLLASILLFIVILLIFSSGIAQINFTERKISKTLTNLPRYAAAGDFDGDGDMDLAADQTGNGDDVVWFRNDGTPANDGWDSLTVSNSGLFNARPLIAIDLDEDGDMDLIGGGQTKPKWWANDGNGNFTENTISVATGTATSGIWAVNLDANSGIDIIASYFVEGKIVWFDNDGTESFIERTVGLLNSANNVHTADIDRDGQIDVLATGSADTNSIGKVVWFRNLGGSPLSFQEFIVDNSTKGAIWIRGKDIDRDGDVDLLVAFGGDDDVVWFENDGSPLDGGWTRHIIDSNFRFVRFVDARDLDGDGDIDVIAAAETDSSIGWYANDGNNNFGTRNDLPSLGGYPAARYGQAVDVDGDGDPDILGVAQGKSINGRVSWFESDAEDKKTIASGDQPPTNFWNNKVTVDFSSGTSGEVSVFFDTEDVPDISKINTADIDHVAPKRFYTLWTNKSGFTASVDFVYDGVWSGITNESTLIICWWNQTTKRWEKAGTNQSIDFATKTITINGLNQFGKFVLGSTTSDNPLPVLLTSFNVEIVSNGVLLEWITQSEINNAGFEIWRSIGAPDAFEFLDGYQYKENLQGSGNSNSKREYTYLDKTVFPNRIYYYQLMSISFNGEREVFGPLKIEIPSSLPLTANQFQLLQNYPNPFNPSTTIPIEINRFDALNMNDRMWELGIYNVLGELVRKFYLGKLSVGRHEILWDGRDEKGNLLPSGTYVAILRHGEKQFTRKMLLLR